MRKIFACLFLSTFILNDHCEQQVDTIVYNGNVYMVNGRFEKAQAFAINNGKIVEVGTSVNILKKYNAKEKIDAKDQAVYPGFIDAHAHFVNYGQSLFEVDLFNAGTWEEVIQRVKKFSGEHPDETWIRGWGWDQNKFPDKLFPSNAALNELFPGKPVLLSRVDGHAAIANQKAFDVAGIKAGKTLTGGEIVLKNNTLTGILIDNAVDLVADKIPPASKEDFINWLNTAEKNCFATGLTTITDCGLMYTDVNRIDSLQKQGKLSIRLYVMLSDNPVNFSQYLKSGPYKTDKLFVKGFKFYADGALGSRGACLLAPYNDRAGWHGFLLSNKEHYDSMADILIKTDFQMCTHAIGDSGNREILNVYNRVLKGKNDKRWRIEHAQVINENDFNLFGRASIVPSVQPTHATSDMYWAKDRLGPERIKGAYAYKQLLDQNGWIALGTDFPVEDISPFKTFLAAVARKYAKGFPVEGFQKENALSREEALKGVTIWAAKADFLDTEIGSIEAGKKADFIIVDQDLMTVQEDDILKTRVLTTFVGGKKVFPH